MAFHRFHRGEEREFQEEQEIASWGVWYLTTGHDENVSGCWGGMGGVVADEILQLTWQIGHNTVVRGQFASNGALNNTKEEDYRPVKERW